MSNPTPWLSLSACKAYQQSPDKLDQSSQKKKGVRRVERNQDPGDNLLSCPHLVVWNVLLSNQTDPSDPLSLKTMASTKGKPYVTLKTDPISCESPGLFVILEQQKVMGNLKVFSFVFQISYIKKIGWMKPIGLTQGSSKWSALCCFNRLLALLPSVSDF